VKFKWICVLLVVVAGFAAYAGNVLATPASGFTGTTLAKATYGEIFSHVHTVPAAWNELIQTKGDSDLYVQQNTWQPGGSTGWHTHPGPSFVIVTQGSVTAYDGDDPTCSPHIYTAGTSNNAFIDPGDGHVHIIRNETASVAQTIAVQLIPAGAVRRQDAPDPGNCSF
jgi:quercetin dioxygenase-like cupin family protein